MSYGALNITNSEFSHNTAGNGGALFPRFDSSVTTISASNFHDNRTTNTTNGWGGAMLLWDGAPVSIDATSFVSNTARQGGAVERQPSDSDLVPWVYLPLILRQP